MNLNEIFLKIGEINSDVKNLAEDYKEQKEVNQAVLNKVLGIENRVSKLEKQNLKNASFLAGATFIVVGMGTLTVAVLNVFKDYLITRVL